ETTLLDLTVALAAPSILVAGSYLGAISHALTALEALKARRLPVSALVISESAAPAVDLAETQSTLARLADGTQGLTGPRHDAEAFAACMARLAEIAVRAMPR